MIYSLLIALQHRQRSYHHVPRLVERLRLYRVFHHFFLCMHVRLRKCPLEEDQPPVDDLYAMLHFPKETRAVFLAECELEELVSSRAGWDFLEDG